MRARFNWTTADDARSEIIVIRRRCSRRVGINPLSPHRVNWGARFDTMRGQADYRKNAQTFARQNGVESAELRLTGAVIFTLKNCWFSVEMPVVGGCEIYTRGKPERTALRENGQRHRPPLCRRLERIGDVKLPRSGTDLALRRAARGHRAARPAAARQ